MKNLTPFAAAALILVSSTSFAAAAPSHHKLRTDRVAVQQQHRNADAFAYWPSEQRDRYDSGPQIYSGGWSAPAGR
jgi:hypothetical protein